MQHTPQFSCVIVDDDPIAVKGLARQIEAVECLSLSASFNHPVQASRFLELNKVDLLFLDVKMPHLDGMSLLKSISNKPLVIFTTAYPMHALEAFEFDAIDYLLKPFSFQKLIRAVNKAIIILRGKMKDHPIDYTFVRSDGKYHKLFFKDIEYIEGMKDYVKVHFAGGVLITAMNLSNILEKFPKEVFTRVHKSYIVNKNKISHLDNYEIMLGTASVPIGAAYREDVHSDILFERVTSK